MKELTLFEAEPMKEFAATIISILLIAGILGAIDLLLKGDK
jgi:hypothetical protein